MWSVGCRCCDMGYKSINGDCGGGGGWETIY